MKKLIILIVIAVLIMPYTAVAKWSTDSSVNTPVVTAEDSQGAHRIIHDGNKGYFAVWHDFRNNTTTGGDIYAQYFNAAGNPQWVENGVAVCDAIGHQCCPKVVLDGSGGIIVSWEDYRAGTPTIYTQKLSANGIEVWPTNGVKVFSQSGEDSEHGCGWLATDGSGGAIILSDEGWVNRIDSSGESPWGNAVNLNPINEFDEPKIMADGFGGAFCVWTEDDPQEIAIRKVSSTGTFPWGGGSPVILSSSSGMAQCPRIVSDGSTGAIVMWQQETGEDTSLYHIYAQKVNSSGTPQWTAGGVQITSANTREYTHGIASDGSGGAFITWIDNGSSYVDARKINSNASLGTTINLSSFGGGVSDSPRKTVEDGNGGFITIWRDSFGDIRAHRVDSGGSSVWPAGGVILSNASGSKGCPRIEGTGKGGAVGIWNLRSGETSSYSDNFSDGVIDASWWEVSGDGTWFPYDIPPTGDGIYSYLGYTAGETTPLVSVALASREIPNYKIMLFTIIGINPGTPGTRSTGVFFGGEDPEDDFERFAAQIHFDNDAGESAFYFKFMHKEYDSDTGETDVTTYYNQELSNYTKGVVYTFAMGVEQKGPGFSSDDCTGDDCVGVNIWDYEIYGLTPPLSSESSFLCTSFEVNHDDLYDSGSIGLETDSPGSYITFYAHWYPKDIYMQGVKPSGALGSPWLTTMAPIMLQLLN